MKKFIDRIDHIVLTVTDKIELSILDPSQFNLGPHKISTTQMLGYIHLIYHLISIL